MSTSIHPEGKSCGHVRSRFECLLSVALLPGPIRSAERYDPAADTWRPAADLPYPACCCAAADAAAVYVMTWGGESSADNPAAAVAAAAKPVVSDNRKAKNERKQRKKDEAEQAAAAAAAVAGAGEEENEREAAEAGALWRYDPDADAYTWLAPLPLPEWYGFAAAAHGGFVYAVGVGPATSYNARHVILHITDTRILSAGGGAKAWCLA